MATDHPPMPKSPQRKANPDLATLQALASLKPGWHKSLVSADFNASPSLPRQLIPSEAAARSTELSVPLDRATLEALRELKPGWEKSLVPVNSNAVATMQPSVRDSPPTQGLSPAAVALDLYPQTFNALKSLSLPQSLKTLPQNSMSSGDMQPAAAPMLDVAASDALNSWGSRTLRFQKHDASLACDAAPSAPDSPTVLAVPPPSHPFIPPGGDDPQSMSIAPQKPKVRRSTLFSTLSAVPDLKANLPEEMLSFANEELPTSSTGPVVSKSCPPRYMS